MIQKKALLCILALCCVQNPIKAGNFSLKDLAASCLLSMNKYIASNFPQENQQYNLKDLH